MKRFISVIVSVCMIITCTFSIVPEVTKAVPGTDLEVSAVSYPPLKPINYKPTGKKANDMVGFARSQVGYVEKSGNLTYFGAWYGMNRQPWCAMFICWCAAKSEVSPTVIPRIANADRGWAKKQKVYHKSYQWGEKYIPKAGDLIYFSWSVRDYADHIGMVSGTYLKNGVRYVKTIEGNKHDRVKEGEYPITNRYILGYASPNYDGVKVKPSASGKYSIKYSANGGSNAPAAQTKIANKPLTLQKGVPTRMGFSFLGWSENARATTPQYKPGATFTANKSVTLFAIWKNNTYKVKTKVTVNRRVGPGMNYGVKKRLSKGQVATVFETRNGWGKLVDGTWIKLSLTTRVTGTAATTTKATAGGAGTYQVTGDLFKRKGPAKTYESVGVLKKGTKVTVVEVKNGWAKLSDGTWSSMKYLKKVVSTTTKATTRKATTKTTTKATTRATTKATTRATTKATTKPTTKAATATKYRVTGNLFKRSGPGKDYAEKGVLKKGTVITVVEIRNGWAKQTDGTWSSMKYLQKVTSGTTQKPATTTTTKAPTTTISTAPITGAGKEFVVKVRVDSGIHMRAAASRSATSKGKLAKNSSVTINAVSGGWGRMKSNNNWILLSLTNFTSGYKVKVSINNLKLRNGPGTNYSYNGFVPPGTYEIGTISEDGAWGKLKYNGKWIMLKLATRI